MIFYGRKTIYARRFERKASGSRNNDRVSEGLRQARLVTNEVSMSRKMKGSRQAGKSKEGAGVNEVLRKQLREADDRQGEGALGTFGIVMRA